MQAPKEILDLAALYLRIYFIGSAVLRSVRDTKRPLYYLFAAGIINVILNLFFVIVLDMDVAGVALATVISETVSAALIIRCMMKESEESGIRLELKSLRIDRDKFIRILRIGLPAGFQGIIFSFSNIVIQSSVNSFGKIVIAGNSAASNVEGFVYMSMNSFYQSTLSFTSQNLGAGNIKRIGRILASGLIYVTVTGLLMGNAAVFFGNELLGIYSSSSDVIAAGMQRLTIIGTTYALCGIMDVLVGSLRGMGYSIMPMIVSLIGACGLRIIWLFTFFRMEQFHSPEMIYITYPVS